MSVKVNDNAGRWRNITVGFRVSKSESDELNKIVKLSGLPKQDYILKRLLCRDIIVVGNPRVYKALRNQLADVYYELHRLEHGGDITPEMAEIIRYIAEILKGFKEENR